MTIFCCYMYVHCISQTEIDLAVNSSKTTSGERVLVKALTAIVNREGNRKKPLQKLELSSFEYP